jgi:hypothetical protein
MQRSLPQRVLQMHGILRFVGRESIHVLPRDLSQGLPLRVDKLIVKHGEEERRDYVVLQLGKTHAHCLRLSARYFSALQLTDTLILLFTLESHILRREERLTTWMPSNSPAKPRVRLLLVFGSVWEVPAGIPLLRVTVHLRVVVDVCDRIHGVCAIRDHGVPNHQVVARDVLAHGRAHHLQADAVPEAQVYQGETGFPYVPRERGKLLDERGLWVGGMGCCNGSDLLAHLGHPLRVLTQVDEDPRSVDTGVEEPGEEGSDDQLQ